MPNGKGFLDCRYCVYALPTDNEWPISFDSSIKCLYHQRELPDATEQGAHRFCINVQPNELWYSEQGGMHIFFPFLQQAARFGAELEPGLLYEYQVPLKDSLKPLHRLREPDYENRSWKAIESEE